jgi:UDP-N-acetylmuramate dehydrogenase
VTSPAPNFPDARSSTLDSDDRSFLTDTLGERVRFDEPLAPHTSWKIGGPADAFATVETSVELAQVLSLIFKRKLPWFVLGSGSNLLVGDGGIRGIVLRLAGEFTAIAVEPQDADVVVRAGASAPMPLLVAQAASLGAIGIGSLAGIPGSVGGALRMNAGTDREFGEFVRDVWVQTPAKPDPHAVTPQYFYRHTTLARDAVVARVTLGFARGETRVVRDEMQTRLVRRKKTQPLQYPNAGSCFRNPPGDSAGRLIEATGAKGWREGGAEVSEIHANFIVNRGDARAADVASLLARVRRAVADRFGVELELEVHFVGVFV